MGIIGIYQINISGSIIEDMPKKSEFFKDILFFDEEFNGIVPVEIIVDSRRKGGATRLSTLKRIDKLEQYINEIPELSQPISSVSGVKLSNKPTTMAIPTTTNFPHRRKILSLLGILRILKALKD